MPTTRDTDNVRQFPAPPSEPEFRDPWEAEALDTGPDVRVAAPIRGIDWAIVAVEYAAEWWRTASREARVMGGIGAAAVTVFGLLLITEVAELAYELIMWVLGRGGDGYAALAGTDVGGTIADPVVSYLTNHATGLPVDGDVAVALWAFAAAMCWVGAAVTAWRGAQIGWAVITVATAWMVYAGTPAPGRETATAITIAVVALLSIPALRRPRRVHHIAD
jgi:hypothetical protein